MIIRRRKTLVWVAVLAAFAMLSSCSSRDPATTVIVDQEDPDNGGMTIGGTINPNPAPIDNGDYEIRATESVYAFRRSSPYATVLKDCIVINTRADSCTTSKLPFIGDGTTQPTIDDVMDRVLVTHDWMGQRFEEVLKTAPTEVMTMFSSTTAVLIGSEVRPSFYTTTNGAIQIDPVYLWSSVDEKGSISKAEDFRSEFGKDLQFWFLSRTADRNGDRLTPFYSLDDNSVRPLEDIEVPLVRLLIHELAHATDFMPRSKIASLDASLSVFDAIDSVYDDWLSPQLSAAHPLTSLDMENFAGVRYRGLDASNQQMATTAADVGQFMASDGAIKFYSYTTIREDLAQLVEAVVMSYRFNSISNIGFTQKPANEETYTCADLLMSWGQRNRLADPLVNVRARAATDLVLGLTPEMTDFLDDSLGSVEAMEDQIGWCDNQATGATVATQSLTRSADLPDTPETGPALLEMIQADGISHSSGMHHH